MDDLQHVGSGSWKPDHLTKVEHDLSPGESREKYIAGIPRKVKPPIYMDEAPRARSREITAAAKERRHKTGYHRTFAACDNCRRRKIRCTVEGADPQNACSNCTKSKRECNFPRPKQYISQKAASPDLKKENAILDPLWPNRAPTPAPMDTVSSISSYFLQAAGGNEELQDLGSKGFDWSDNGIWPLEDYNSLDWDFDSAFSRGPDITSHQITVGPKVIRLPKPGDTFSSRDPTAKMPRKSASQLLFNVWARLLRPRVPERHRRIEWTCDCSHDLYADFANLSWVDAREIAKILQTPSTLAGTLPTAPSSSNFDTGPGQELKQGSSTSAHSSTSMQGSSDLTNRSSARTTSSSTQSSGQPVTLDATFLELCVNTGEHLKTLGEIDLTNVRSDGDMFNAIKEHYLRLRSFRSKFWLLKPAAVNYVRFSVENRHRVGILQKPLAIPPKSEVDCKNYTYVPCPLNGDPPIAENVFLHYLQCPESSRILFWMLRLPRKVHPSILTSNSTTAFGWGVHIDEGPNYQAIIWVNFVVLVLSGVLALAWKVMEKDFQGAFGFAGWVVMVLNTLMMAFVFKWRQE